MLFIVILVATVFASLAMMVREGLWNNTIALVQIILSGLTAFLFYQPLVVMLDERTDGEYTYALDIVVLWAVYCVTLLLLKVLCESLSKYRMKFPGPVDDYVAPLVGLIAGAVLAGIIGASLHVTPLPRDGLGGGMDYSGTSVAAQPPYVLDATWLKAVEAASHAGLRGDAQFSAEDFVVIYGDRRERYEEADGLRVKRR